MRTPDDELGKEAKGMTGDHRGLDSPMHTQCGKGLGRPTQEASNIDRNGVSHTWVILKNGQQPA